MKKPNKKDSKYRLLGFFFYWGAYKKDLQLYNALQDYNPPKLKKKDVKDAIDVKRVKPEIDVRTDEIPENEPKSLVDKMRGYTMSWHAEQEQYNHHRSTQDYLEHMARQSVGIPDTGRRTGKTTRMVDEVIQKLFARRGERVSISFQRIIEAKHFEQILQRRMREEHGIAVECQVSSNHPYNSDFITLVIREKIQSHQNDTIEEAVQCIIGKGGYTRSDFISEESARYFYREVSDQLRLKFGHDRCHYRIHQEGPFYAITLEAH